MGITKSVLHFGISQLCETFFFEFPTLLYPLKKKWDIFFYEFPGQKWTENFGIPTSSIGGVPSIFGIPNTHNCAQVADIKSE